MNANNRGESVSWPAQLYLSILSTQLSLHLQALEKTVNADMKQVSEYFGELHEAGDPSKMLRVISNFLTVFDATLDEIKVCEKSLILWLLWQVAQTIAWKAPICWTAFQ